MTTATNKLFAGMDKAYRLTDMTGLRDLFAMAAMEQLIDCTQWKFGRNSTKNVDEIDARELANEAYSIADAMLAARQRKRRK